MLRTIYLSSILLCLLLPLQSSARTQIPVIDWTPGSDWTNVKEHGVVGDGVADDTDAIQGLLSELQPGGILYFPPGEYRITRELLIQKSREGNPREKRLMGVGFYGHGVDTVLKYDGEPGAVMLRIRGMLHYRMEGLVFDGSGKARVGMYHDNRLPDGMLFETHLYHSYITMRNFTEYGILFGYLDDNPAGASAETTFQHMIFENSGTGITFNNFNDYNFTFDGCLFRDNARMGIECVNGNFYVRNSRFENNRLDVFANPEHSSSIRRSVSVGSGSFLQFQNSVSPFTVENCLVVDWKGPAAIQSSGAPLLLFDNHFVNSTEKVAAIDANPKQEIVYTANSVKGAQRLLSKDSDTYVTTTLSEGASLHLSADMDFMPQSVEVPGRLFDAKVDFGAVGDGKADDTDAIQAAIDAARSFGNNAMAYLPKGKYRITHPLRLEGGGYSFGGGTVYSELYFDGDKDGDAIIVTPEGELTLDTFRVKRSALEIEREDRDEGWRVRTYKVGVFDGKGVDIRQLPSENGSKVIYRTVYVTGKYVELPFHLGLRLDGLRAHDSVVLHNVEGNLQFFDSGDATILQTVGYEGTFWVKGENREGFLGIMTRLATLTKHSIFVEDSQSLVASDFYEEQAPPEAIVLTGKAGDIPGRLTLGFVKTDRVIHIRDYVGEVNLVASQFYQHRSNGPPGIIVEGTPPQINLVSNFFYVPKFVVEPADLAINTVGSSGDSDFNDAEIEMNSVHLVDDIEGSIQDLRKLGLVDWQLNYPGLLAPNDEALTKEAAVNHAFPEIDLRGYGTVSGEEISLSTGASLLTIQCESPEKAELLQAKYLSDLTVLPKTKMGQVSFGEKGRTVPTCYAEDQGYILAARMGSEVRILAASQREALETALNEGDWTGWSFSTEATVPMYLDRWDKWGFRSHYRPWTGAPKQYIEQQGEGAYDFLEEFQFAEDMDNIGMVVFAGNNPMDTAEGLDNSTWWEWIVPLTEEHGLPFGLNLKVAEGSEALWLANRYRDQMMQPMPQFGGSYMRIGSPYFGTRGTTSWGAGEANQIQFDMVENILRRFADQPNLVTVLEPHGELKNLSHSIFMEYGPVADASYQEYLQTLYPDLSALNRAWGTDYTSWEAVRVPEIASFAGWSEDAFDLTGEWKLAYETLALKHAAKEDDLLYFNESNWVRAIETEPAPEAWFTTDWDDSSWAQIQAPGDEQSLLTPSRPAVMRRHFKVSQDWLDKHEQVWLYVWDMNLASKDTFKAVLNDTVVDTSTLELMQPHWTAVDVTEQLKTGDNVLALRLPKGKLSYRAYLSGDSPDGYPYFENERNAQWYDFAMWHCWLRREAVRHGLETIRKVLPNQQAVQMAPDAYFDDVKELSREYGSNFHNTGYMSGFWADFLPSLMRGADLPMSLEPGGPAKDLARFKSMQGLWMTEGIQAVDYFIHIGSLMWDPEIRQYLKDNLPLFNLIGKYHQQKAEVAALYSSESTRLNGFPWILDPNKLLSSGYWSWNVRGYLRDYYDSDGLSESSFANGDAAAYRVILDTNTSIMSEAMVSDIEQYVRDGGTFVTYAQTGRHSTVEADAWPIARLTGYSVEKIDALDAEGNVLESGQLMLASGQDVLSGAWDGFRANGLHLRKVASDAENVLLWDDGSVALGVRPLGKGYIVQIGCKFNGTKIRDRLDPEQRSLASLHALPENGDDALTNLLVQLLEWRQITPLPFQWKANADGVIVRHYLSNNGLYDIWALWNQNASLPVTGQLQLRDQSPAWCIDLLDNAPLEMVGGVVLLDLKPLETRMLMTPRGDIQAAPSEWFTLQRNWWRGTTRSDEAPAEPIALDNILDLTDDWAVHVLQEGEKPDAFVATTIDDVNWPRERLGVWQTADWPEPKTLILRREFTIPEDWSGDVSITMESKSASFFCDDGAIYLNGNLIRKPASYGMDGFTAKSLQPGSTHTLTLVISTDSTLCGVRGNAWLWLWPTPDARIDLAGQWQTSPDALNWGESVSLPGKYDASLLRRAVMVPATFDGLEHPQAYLDADALNVVGAIVNGHFVRRYHRITADRFQLNVTPWIRFGEENEIELVHYWRAPSGGEVKSVRLNIYSEPY